MRRAGRRHRTSEDPRSAHRRRSEPLGYPDTPTPSTRTSSAQILRRTNGPLGRARDTTLPAGLQPTWREYSRRLVWCTTDETIRHRRRCAVAMAGDTAPAAIRPASYAGSAEETEAITRAWRTAGVRGDSPAAVDTRIPAVRGGGAPAGRVQAVGARLRSDGAAVRATVGTTRTGCRAPTPQSGPARPATMVAISHVYRAGRGGVEIGFGGSSAVGPHVPAGRMGSAASAGGSARDDRCALRRRQLGGALRACPAEPDRTKLAG
jgi:hypothetical protein